MANLAGWQPGRFPGASYTPLYQSGFSCLCSFLNVNLYTILHPIPDHAGLRVRPKGGV
jgi:hypothetical protein